jgi:hypothetical protein
MVAKRLLCAAFLLCLSTQAHALCKDDLAAIKPRIDLLKPVSLQRYYLATKWWTRAMAAEPASELECVNLLVRVRKVVSAPLVEIVDCVGPNVNLPRCQPGGQNGTLTGWSVGPVVPLPGAGGSNVMLPVAPTTQGGDPPFNPPGSVDRGQQDQRGGGK